MARCKHASAQRGMCLNFLWDGHTRTPQHVWTNGPLHSIHLSVFQLNSALSPSPVARGGLAFTSRISLFMCGELSRTLRTDALGHSKCWPQRLWIGGSVVPPKRGVCVCVFLWAEGVGQLGLLIGVCPVCVCAEHPCEAPKHARSSVRVSLLWMH